MKINRLPEIPNSYIILILAGALVVMRFFYFDSWVTATLSIIIGYLTGVKMEQARKR